MKDFSWYVWILYFTLTGSIQAQEVSYISITSKQGLPSNTVYDLHQSRDGFVWVATENGICRFNGYDFKIYRNTKTRTNSVSNICEDQFGRIWINNFFGEILYIEDDSLKIFEPWQQYYQNGFPEIATKGDSLLIVNASDAYIYSFSRKNFSHISAASQIMISKENGELWTKERIGKNQYVLEEITSGMRILTDQDEAFPAQLLTFRGEDYLFNPYSKTLYKVGESRKLVKAGAAFGDLLAKARTLKALNSGHLAFFGIDGLYLFNDSLENSQQLVQGKNISKLIELTEGGMLVSTLNDGLLFIPDLGARRIKSESGSFRKLAYDRKRKQVVVGDFKGWISFYNTNGQLEQTVRSDTIWEIQAMDLSAERNLLVFQSDKLYEYSLADHNFSRRQNSFPIKDVHWMNSAMVVAGSGGVVSNPFDLEKRDYRLMGERLTSLTSIGNILYFGGQNGLSKASLTPNGRFENLDTLLPHQKYGINALATDWKRLYAGTSTMGLLIFEDDMLISHLTVDDGLPSNIVTCLRADHDEIWIGTDQGIASLDTNRTRLTKYDQKYGLTAREIYDLTPIDDKIWVTSNQGIHIIDRSKTKRKAAPMIIVDKVEIDMQKLVPAGDKITLLPTQNQVNFHFDVSRSISDLGATKIFYRINELNDQQWNQSTLKNPTATYLSLPPGEYTFSAFAESTAGVRSNVIDRILVIQSPIYQKPWFVILLTILICSIIASLLYSRFRWRFQRNEALLLHRNKEQQLRIAQLSSIRAQMNPHFIFNTMTLIQGKVIEGLTGEASRIIKNFSQLMRSVLDYSQEEYITLTEEIAIIQKYLTIESDRTGGELKFELTVSPSLETDFIEIPSLITHAFVENAIRHGLLHKQGSKRLTVDFLAKDQHLLIRIEDNGIGRKAAGELAENRYKGHKSFATHAIQQRIALLNETRPDFISIRFEDLWDQKGLNSMGTLVELQIRLPHGE